MPRKIVNSSLWCADSKHKFYYAGAQAIDCVQQMAALEFDQLLPETLWQSMLGAFAVVVINPNTHEILLARDHFGCQPLYYYVDSARLVFGSSLPDIIQQLPSRPALNESRVVAWVTCDYRYSDDTCYHGIYRVEPGSMVRINAGGSIKKSLYWQLDENADDLILANDKQYLERFSELIHESIAFNTQGVSSQLAGELSGGLDSSAILTTAQLQQCHYPLFMHVANPGSKLVDDRHLADILLKHFNHSDASFVTAQSFDPISEFQYCAQYFAGGSPFLCHPLTQNINRAISERGCQIVLSGAGGDECVSGHACYRAYLPGLLHQRGFSSAWQALWQEHHSGLKQRSRLKRAALLIQHYHPTLYQLVNKIGDMRAFIKKLPRPSTNRCDRGYYPSVRAHERDLLQGEYSQALRLRIEYCAVLGQSLGLSYRYPLLYPKLVEFCFRLPLEQKRRGGLGRHLIRRYLAQHVPQDIYQKQQKIGGYLPGTADKCLSYLSKGEFDRYFVRSPLTHHDDLMYRLIANVPLYMFKYWFEKTGQTDMLALDIFKSTEQ